jgi:hypothetical protein
MELPGVPRHKAVWATPCLTSCVGNHQGYETGSSSNQVGIKMFGGLMIRRVLRVKVLRVSSEILIRGIMMAIRVMAMAMEVVIMETSITVIRIETFMNLGIGIISVMALAPIDLVQIVRAQQMQQRCKSLCIYRRQLWR